MKVIVGLGNIGNEYAHTRHNVGFDVLELVESKRNLNFIEKKEFKAYIASDSIEGEKVLWVKPTTYMNLSGDSVGAIMRYYKVDIDDVLVIHDDLDLPVGKCRLRQGGSAGGQKGMNHIIQCLGTSNIARIRVGIGKDPLIPVVDYVLGKVKSEDKQVMQQAFELAANACTDFAGGISFQRIMNTYNQRKG